MAEPRDPLKLDSVAGYALLGFFLDWGVILLVVVAATFRGDSSGGSGYGAWVGTLLVFFGLPLLTGLLLLVPRARRAAASM